VSSTTALTDAPGEAAPAGAPEPGLTLLYTNGLARAGEQLSLAGRSAVLVGRQERLFPGGPLDDPRMSSRHAALARDHDRWVLVDRTSKNGTFIGGERVTERALTPGDVIRLGSTFIAFAPVPAGPRSSAQAPDELVGVGLAAAELREDVRLVAPTDQTVLLLGESGSGKEVVARQLHRQSGRPGPSLAVNCASLRGELLESELFGHVRGAFTGAQRAHDGLFVRADRGTVFLDEVGEMDEGVQARLLRVLEARAVRPVGASEEVPVGTRVVAATNRDALALVRAERLRADLYARLSRWTITVPPLRERIDDLGVLARAILARAAPDRAPLDVTPELMAALVAARWPLNVRGLVNVLEGARIAQPGVSRLDLVPRVADALADQARLAAPAAGSRAPSEGAPPDAARVSEALGAHAGNVAAAARDLGLTRQSLYRLIERLGLDATTFRG